LLPIELIIFNCWLTLYYKATRTAWLWGAGATAIEFWIIFVIGNTIKKYSTKS
jgi:hypothetical protein